MNIDSVWKNVLEKLSYAMNATSYNNWIATLSPVGIIDGEFVINAKNELTKKTVTTLYTKVIQDAVFSASGENIPVRFVLENELPATENDIITEPAPFLNSKYTFDTFIVGESNNFANAVARAITDFFPNTSMYNPFFLYGGVGLGKTHLMHAIGNEIYRKYPDKKIVYVSSETFTNDVISAIRPSANGDASVRSLALRKKYRDVDVFMIDDIQFVAGKTSTESEFFHTFNQLFMDEKQIIISADRPPHDLPLIDARMKTRFASGVIADIQQPEFETRVAILKNRAETRDISISNELLNKIAEKVDSNVRELEGTFNTIVAQAQLTNCRITSAMIDRIIKDKLNTRESQRITVEMIIDAVSDYYDVSQADIIGTKRNKNIVHARQVAIYICREVIGDISYNEIGKAFGNKHYSTIIHSYETIQERINNDKNTDLKVSVEDIISRLKDQ